MKFPAAFLNHPLPFLAGAALAFSLSACNRADNNDAAVAELDNKLVGKDSNAENAALDDRILVDPELAGNSNDASIEALDSAKLIRAPKPTIVGKEECTGCGATTGQTLGSRAADQGVTSGKGTCDAKMQYGTGWASRMPPEFPVYPGSQIKEAGGVDGGICDIRVATFTTTAKMQNVVDYYYTRASRSGFSAEYQVRSGEHVLGGTRDNDGGAYFITFNPRPDGGTSVDIVANNGR